MGRGNTLIRDSEGDGVNTFYIDFYECDKEIDEDTGKPHCDGVNCDCNANFLSDVLGNIEFDIASKIKGMNNYFRKKGDMRLGKIFETDYIQVLIDDNETSLAIGCCPVYTDDCKVRNKAVYLAQSNKFMRLLNGMYELRERDGSWTSGLVSNDQYKFY